MDELNKWSLLSTYGDVVACTPFSTNEVTSDKKRFIAVAESNNALEELTVMVGNEKIRSGSKIYVKKSHKISPWAMSANTVVLNGVSLIFVPMHDILIVNKVLG